MTFVAAVRGTFEGLEYAVLLADSQETYKATELKTPSQKIYQIGPSLIMVTGNLHAIDAVVSGAMDSLLSNTPVRVPLYERIRTACEDRSHVISKEDLLGTRILVSEFPATYTPSCPNFRVITWDPQGNVAIYQEPSYLDGSGTTKLSGPIQKTNGIIKASPIEAILELFAKFTEAKTDLYVDTNFQIGIQAASSEHPEPVSRVLLPRGVVEDLVDENYFRLSCFYGLSELHDYDAHSNAGSAATIQRWTDEFIRVLGMQLESTTRAKDRATTALTNTKYWEDFDCELGRLRPMVDTLMSGKFVDVIDAVKGYHNTFYYY